MCIYLEGFYYIDTMNIEKEPTEELHQKAKELERMNTAVENMEEGKERTEKIEEMDMLESKIEEIEKMTGLSSEEIMSQYDDLTLETAREGIGEVIEELGADEDKKAQLEDELQSGNPGALIEEIKTSESIKDKAQAVMRVAACFLTITIASLSADVSESQAGGSFDIGKMIEKVEKKAEKKVKKIGKEFGIDIENIEINDKTIEQAKEILKDADEKARETIESIEGIFGGMKKKKAIDNIADNSDDILSYLEGESEELPQLHNEIADSLMGVYTKAIEEADKLDDTISKEVRRDIIDKIKVVQTRDIEEIKKRLQV